MKATRTLRVYPDPVHESRTTDTVVAKPMMLRLPLCALLAFAVCVLWPPKMAASATTIDQIQVERYKADRVQTLHRQDAEAAVALHREDAAVAMQQTALDKGFLALLVAIAGFVISRSLYRYQALLNADGAVEAKRFEILDDVWTSMNECEHVKHEVHRLLRRGARSVYSRRILSEHQETFELKSAITRLKVDQKAHLLGRGEHREITLYHKTLTKLFYAYLQRNVPDIARYERELAKRRQYVDDRRDMGGRFARSPSRGQFRSMTRTIR